MFRHFYRRLPATLLSSCVLMLAAAAPCAAATAPLMLLGIPIDFVLFGITLAGVAIFHRHTLPVALTGLGAIVAYKLTFAGFKFGSGIGGLRGHMEHESVTLVNLLLLLLGFSLLSRHFEKSRIPVMLPRFLPTGWQGGF